jgi:hypothetical protein
MWCLITTHNMKKILIALLFLFPALAFAATVPWDRPAAGRINPLFILDQVIGNYFTATSTTQASTFPYASTTAITATTASTTNLLVSSAGGTAGCATFSVAGLISNTGSACGGNFGKTWELINGALSPTTTVGIIVNASSSITNLSVINGTTTNATSTNLNVSGQLRVGSIGALLLATGGNVSAYGGVTCTNQFLRALSGVGASTCATVSLTADVTGDLPFSNLAQVSAGSVLGNPTGSTADAQSVSTSTLYGAASTGGFVLQWSNALSGLVLAATSSGAGGGVTSVAQTVPGNFTVAGSPITTSGTLAITYNSSSTPFGKFVINPVAGDANSFVIGSSTATHLVVNNAGNFSFGTDVFQSGPKVNIFQAASTAQLRLSKSASLYSELTVDSTGDLQLGAAGGDISMLTENLIVCGGGSCPAAFTPLITGGNLYVENNVGIASSTPMAALTVATSTIINTEFKPVSTSTTKAVHWDNGTQQLFKLGTVGVTFTFDNYVNGQTLRMITCAPDSGTMGTITWPAAIRWVGGTTPSQTTTAQKCDIYSFIVSQATSTTAGASFILGAQSANF